MFMKEASIRKSVGKFIHNCIIDQNYKEYEIFLVKKT